MKVIIYNDHDKDNDGGNGHGQTRINDKSNNDGATDKIAIMMILAIKC